MVAKTTAKYMLLLVDYSIFR